jgi:hypothetical protein
VPNPSVLAEAEQPTEDYTGYGDYTDQALADELLGVHWTVPLKRVHSNLLTEAAQRLKQYALQPQDAQPTKPNPNKWRAPEPLDGELDAHYIGRVVQSLEEHVNG